MALSDFHKLVLRAFKTNIIKKKHEKYNTEIINFLTLENLTEI